MEDFLFCFCRIYVTYGHCCLPFSSPTGFHSSNYASSNRVVSRFFLILIFFTDCILQSFVTFLKDFSKSPYNLSSASRIIASVSRISPFAVCTSIPYFQFCPPSGAQFYIDMFIEYIIDELFLCFPPWSIISVVFRSMLSLFFSICRLYLSSGSVVGSCLHLFVLFTKFLILCYGRHWEGSVHGSLEGVGEWEKRWNSKAVGSLCTLLLYFTFCLEEFNKSSNIVWIKTVESILSKTSQLRER